MKTIILGILTVCSMNAYAANSTLPTGLKSCSEHLGEVRACIDIWKPTSPNECSNTIKSGEIWVDEFSMTAIEEMYTTEKDYCSFLTDYVPYDGPNQDQVVEYCCGG